TSSALRLAYDYPEGLLAHDLRLPHRCAMGHRDFPSSAFYSVAMWPRRTLSAIGVFLGIGSTLGLTVAYGVYYRSDHYRREVESSLNQFFGLPVEVDGVEPHTFTARKLTGIRMWLPGKRAQIFDCPVTVWDAMGSS